MMTALALAALLLAAPAAGQAPPEAETGRAPLSAPRIESLFLLSKVWGFLKYHHPRVTEGCLDWDGFFITWAGRLVRASDDERAADLLAAWSGELSDASCPPKRSGDVQIRADIGWLNDHELLGLELGSQLRSIETRVAETKPQHYLTVAPGIGNPQFRNESNYAERGFPEWPYRVLALARLWNIVEYWYPYRDLLSGDWDEVLLEFLPRMYSADSERQYVLELMALLARLKDGHANLWSEIRSRPPAGTGKPPFAIRMVEGHPFVGERLALVEDAEITYAPGECLSYGDLIIEVQGRTVAELFADWAPYYGASNDIARRDAMAWDLLRGDTDIVAAVVERGGTKMDVNCLRVPLDKIASPSDRLHDRPGVTLQLLDQEIAYLKLSTFDADRVGNYVAAAEGTRGLIIDIRGYPESFAVFALGRHLVTEATEIARFTRADITLPGTFLWAEPVRIEPAEPTYEGRVVVLVDEVTFSQAEYTAMAFRAVPDALLVGSRTAGADGEVSSVPLPGGYSAALSGIGVFYPDKTPTQKVGILPDIEVVPTIAGLRQRRDEVLEAAIRELLGDEAGEAKVRAMAGRPQD